MLATYIYDYLLNKLSSISGSYLEIGIYDGEGIAMLAKKYPDKILYCIDPFIDDGCTTHISGVDKGGALVKIRDAALKNISDYKNIILFEVLSNKFNQHLPGIECILIDGDHSYEECCNDFELSMRLLNEGGLLIFDDMQVEGVSNSVKLFETKYGERIITSEFIAGATAKAFYLKPTNV